jgi:EAL domain-containing protein (putative c-di-GMP-specific phosphodiesterase class I)
MTKAPTFPLLSKLAVPGIDTGEDAPGDLPRLLRAAREHLGMEVSFISEFAHGQRVFRYVDAADPGPVQVGGADQLEDSYCQRVVDGRLPQLIRDARQEPGARELSATEALPVGAHLSVPIVLRDGTVYGTFCCFSRTTDHTLTERDLSVVRVFADMASTHLDAEHDAARESDAIRRRIETAVTVDGSLTTLFQPVVSLHDGRVIGVEALSRFRDGDAPPNEWFDDAHSVGLGPALEGRAVTRALTTLSRLPEPMLLGVNVSPAMAVSPELRAALTGVDVARVVLEMTEHEPVADYGALGAALRPLRERGLRIAIDDAGAGYASLRHILWLAPDYIKLDISITRDIDADPARAALAEALVSFAGKIDSQIVAEGVETDGELRTLQALGVTLAQGYHLGRPTDLDEALERRHDVVA